MTQAGTAETPKPDAPPSLHARILEEWPAVDPGALAATQGDREAMVALVAQTTEHTRTLITKQIGELEALDHRPSPRIPMPDIEAAIAKLEAHTKRLVDQVQNDVLPTVEQRAKDNVGKSLLTALGLGFILGLLFGGFGRGRS